MNQQLIKKEFHKKVVVFILASCMLLPLQQLFAQMPSIKTSVSKKNILIGEQLDFSIEASMPANSYGVTWFSVPDSFGKFEVVFAGKIDSAVVNNDIAYSQTLTITNFDSGRRVIPRLPISITTFDTDSTFTMFTDSVAVNILYAPMDSIMPFHDIKTIVSIKEPWPWWLWALLIAGGILLIIGIIYLLKYLKKKKTPNELFTSLLSPYDEAMQAIVELEKENLIENNKEKEFHSRLVTVFKRFISRQTNTNKMSLTTNDILMEIGKYNISRQQIGDFANCLRMGNVVKFAQFIPSAVESNKCLTKTTEIIEALHHNLNQKPENDI